MANLTEARDDERQEGDLIDVAYGSNTIYAGAIVCVDSNGYATTGASGLAVLGVAMENSENAALQNRGYIRVWAKGEFAFNKESATVTDLGKYVVVSDDNTVALADSEDANQIVGKITGVNTTDNTVRVVLTV